jgi:hypothetical protein
MSKVWMKLNKMGLDLRRLLIGETDKDILECKKALEVIDKTANILKKRIES